MSIELYRKPDHQIAHDLTNRDNHCLNPGCDQIGGIWCSGLEKFAPPDITRLSTLLIRATGVNDVLVLSTVSDWLDDWLEVDK